MSTITFRSEYKKLYARTLKLGIESYLITDRCSNILLEHGADELFNNCLRHVYEQSNVAILLAGYTGYHRDALGLFIDHGFEQPPWLGTFTALLTDFAAWKTEQGQERPNFTPVLLTFEFFAVRKDSPEVLCSQFGEGFGAGLISGYQCREDAVSLG